MESEELFDYTVNILKKKKAENITRLELKGVSDVTDNFIICTAQTIIHSRALVDAITQELKKKGIVPNHIEGYEWGRWILMDYVDFVIHIFLQKERNYYNLERLWGDVPREIMDDKTED